MTTDAARRFLAALLLRAVRDAAGDDPALAAPARRWLAQEGLTWAEMLGLDPGKVTVWVAGLESLAWEQLALL